MSKKNSLEKHIEELTQQIIKLETEANDLHAKSFVLREEREQTISQMILDESILDDTHWILKVNPVSHELHLNYVHNKNDAGLQFLKEVGVTDYHSWFELADGIQLRFDDKDIYLTFKESRQAMPFIKKHNLKVSGTGVSDKLAKLKREVSALEEICHRFNI